MEEYNEDYVIAVAGAIRDKFIELKKEQLNKYYYQLHPRHDKAHIWEKSARQCLELKADPENFVRACFDYCQITNGPFPNSMGGPASKKWYGEFLKTLETKGIDDGDVSDISYKVVEEDLKRDIMAVRNIIKGRTGNYYPTKENIDWIVAQHNKIKPHIRILLSYPDPRGREVCREEALNEFVESENLRNAANNLGYPVNKIMEWL